MAKGKKKPVEVKEEPVSTDEGYDQFLQDATLAIREMWEKRGGLKVEAKEAQDLNDMLDSFFVRSQPM